MSKSILLYKKITYAALTLVALVLIIWISTRWNIWFGHRIEYSSITKPYPHNIQLSFGTDGLGERIVTWQSALKNEQSTLTFHSSSRQDTSHIIPTITHFKTDSVETYFYKAIIPTPYQNDTISYTVNDAVWHMFHTFSPSNFTALCLGDIQSKSLDTTQLLDSIIQFTKPDFIIQAGDLVERPFAQYWSIYFEEFNNITPSIPMLAALGNHDYHKFPNKVPDIRNYLTFPYLANESTDASQPAVYKIQIGKINFYIFDTNRFYCGLTPQVDWLESQPNNPNHLHIAIMHHPPYSNKSYWNNIDVRFALSDAMEDFGMDLVLAGHEHLHSFSTPTSDDIPFPQLITHFSMKNYSETQSHHRYFSTLEYNNNRLFFKVYDDEFKIVVDCEIPNI